MPAEGKNRLFREKYVSGISHTVWHGTAATVPSESFRAVPRSPPELSDLSFRVRGQALDRFEVLGTEVAIDHPDAKAVLEKRGDLECCKRIEKPLEEWCRRRKVDVGIVRELSLHKVIYFPLASDE